MYPAPFHYHRAESLQQAISMLSEFGDDAKVLAGGQSLIPLMKLRLSAPSHLIDLNFIAGLDGVSRFAEDYRIGPLVRHADLAESPAAEDIPSLGDCASGIADVQVRNRGTIAGSVAEADPSGDWIPVLMTLSARIHCRGPQGARGLSIDDFVEDAYATALSSDEVIEEIRIEIPASGSGGAYLAFKRSAQVYATAGAAVQMTLQDGVVSHARIALNSVGLTVVRATEAEDFLSGRSPDGESLKKAALMAAEAADPFSDSRGTADYKRALVEALVSRAGSRAVRRCRGERVEGGHEYV